MAQKFRVATTTGGTIAVTAESEDRAREIVRKMKGRLDAQRRPLGDPTTVTVVKP